MASEIDITVVHVVHVFVSLVFLALHICLIIHRISARLRVAYKARD